MNFKNLQAVASIPVACIKSIAIKDREDDNEKPNVEVHETQDVPLLLVITKGDKEIHIQFD